MKYIVRFKCSTVNKRSLIKEHSGEIEIDSKNELSPEDIECLKSDAAFKASISHNLLKEHKRVVLSLDIISIEPQKQGK